VIHDFALLMDLDGTLLDTDPLHVEAFQRLLAPFGRAITEDYYISKIMGAPIDTIMQELFPDASLEDRQALGDKKEAHFRDQLTGPLKAKAGLHNFLSWAKRHRFGLAIVTNAPRDNAMMMIEGLRLREQIDHILIGDELPHSKPHPYPYAEAARRLGVPIDRSLAFEDSGPGIQSASGAGVCTFGLIGAFEPDRLIRAGATHAIADYNAPLLWQSLEAMTGATSATAGAAR
jgi:HAD superfamily hydrolase (TIGR01509 family)